MQRMATNAPFGEESRKQILVFIRFISTIRILVSFLFMQKREFSTEIGGKKLTATFSDLADQTNGSVILSYGKTSVLATAVMSESEREGIDFFPLVVDYEEKFYAAGEILGSRFMRREGKPSDEAVLSGRAVDRTIRPLFDQHIRNEVQIVLTILAID